MTTGGIESDPAAFAFAGAGHALQPVRMLDDPDSPLVVGWRIAHLGAELDFRTVPPASVLLIRYLRLQGGRGLRNQFTAMIWFVEFLIARQPVLGIRQMVGTIDTSLFRAEGGLDDNRLFRFYAHCGARLIGPAEMPGLGSIERRWYEMTGARWACIDFADYHRPGRAGLRSAS